MACVPGGNVMAKVIGVPFAFASSTSGFSAFGSSFTAPFHSFLSVMLWPLRLIIQGIIIGFFGDPRRPIVEAIGMPVNMCVAWLVPLDSESRFRAHMAPTAT